MGSIPNKRLVVELTARSSRAFSCPQSIIVLSGGQLEKVTLTDREEAIAQRAAQIAIENLATHFYANVGRNVVTKLLIYIGMGVVGFMLAKGWVKWPG